MNVKKYKYSIFFVFLGILLCTNIAESQTNNERFDKVVIDAGHGGVKPGAIGAHNKEKDITLAVALKLGRIINENLKAVKVFYTRVIDQDIDLYKRSTVANKINADLFISIHCNSSTIKVSNGTETFTMGLAKTAQNIAVAKQENSEMLTEANHQENYEGFDINSPESDILLSLYQTAYLNNSLDFADKIQKEYTKNTPMKSRGVKQANLVVLWKASMPAVLTEIGFISNSQEEAYISSDIGQWTIAACIFRAIVEYKNKVDNTNMAIPSINTLIPKDVLQQEQVRLANEKLEKEKRDKELAEEKQRQEQEQKNNSSNKNKKIRIIVQK
jgi:N-acetylmuramoyl-L-alanine amidase